MPADADIAVALGPAASARGMAQADMHDRHTRTRDTYRHVDIQTHRLTNTNRKTRQTHRHTGIRFMHMRYSLKYFGVFECIQLLPLLSSCFLLNEMFV